MRRVDLETWLPPPYLIPALQIKQFLSKYALYQPIYRFELERFLTPYWYST
jgi:hypothetical protein